MVGRHKVVGTGARYGVDGLGIKSRSVGEIFRTRPHTGPAVHPKGTGSFSGLRRSGRDIEHLPPSNAEVKDNKAILLLPF